MRREGMLSLEEDHGYFPSKHAMKKSFHIWSRTIFFAFVSLVPLHSAAVAAGAQAKPVTRLELGLGIPFSYNTANATTTNKDLRTGLAVAAKADFFLWQQNLSLMVTFSKAQAMWSREDGLKNTDVCNETFSMSLASFPGYCTQYQARLQPLLWFQSIAVGISFVYNHFTDISFKGSHIYNTKWAYGALGIVGGFRINRGRFSLLALANLDYGIFSQTATVMTPTQSIQGVQAGLTIYGMYALY